MGGSPSPRRRLSPGQQHRPGPGAPPRPRSASSAMSDGLAPIRESEDMEDGMLDDDDDGYVPFMG